MKPHSEEHRRKLSEALKGKPGTNRGRHFSEEWKRKISESNKGRIGGMEGKRHSEETKRKIGLANKGKYRSEETKQKLSRIFRKMLLSKEYRRKISESRKGQHLSEETKRKIGLANKGDKHWHWKGGITPEHTKIRMSIEYRLWREAVFARDNWTCQECGKRGGNLNVHHIKSFSKYPELRFALDNGITFCEKCHKKQPRK